MTRDLRSKTSLSMGAGCDLDNASRQHREDVLKRSHCNIKKSRRQEPGTAAHNYNLTTLEVEAGR